MSYQREDEIGPIGVVRVNRRQVGHVAGKTDGAFHRQVAVEVTRIHCVESGNDIGDQADRDDEEVLEQDVDRVLLSRQT